MRKETFVSSLESLPADVDSEDLIEKILFLKNLDEAIEQADNNQLLTEGEVRQLLGKWLS